MEKEIKEIDKESSIEIKEIEIKEIEIKEIERANRNVKKFHLQAANPM